MAQFVTHIQPTLMEASHHHAPHHPMHHHPPKDHHAKDHHSKDHHHGAIHKDPSKDLESHLKDVQMHQGHPRDFPVLPPHQPLHYKDFAEFHHQHYDAEPGSGTHSHRNSGHYLDSHGVPHEYQLHFIDSQGIVRDYHGHAIDIEGREHDSKEKSHKDKDHKNGHNKDKHHKEDKHGHKHDEKIGSRKTSMDKICKDKDNQLKPVPPQFIDLHSPQPIENKLDTPLPEGKNSEAEATAEAKETNNQLVPVSRCSSCSLL